MDVIGHQYIGMHGAAGAPADIAQVFEIAQAVDGLEEARLPVIASLDDVPWHVGRSIRWRKQGRSRISPCFEE